MGKAGFCCSYGARLSESAVAVQGARQRDAEMKTVAPRMECCLVASRRGWLGVID